VRVHRLVLDDFRGVDHRELLLPDNGIVVLEGANEVGKSSMLEALDMLLTEKHTSRKASVLAVKPVHRDAPSRVEAEISTGPYRFTLAKQWHTRPATTLTVHTPRVEQLTGDDAHRRVQEILTETLDANLWDALRVLQNTAPRALGGSSALAAALDAAAGSAPSDGEAQNLFDAVVDHRATYWTATGKPTGDHRGLAEELDLAREAERRARTALDVVAEDSERHAGLVLDRSRVQARWTEVREQADALTELVADLATRRERLGVAREQAALADRAAQDAATTLAGRRREVTDLSRRTAALDRDEVRAADLRPAVEEARACADEAVTTAEEAAGALERAQQQAEHAREALRHSQDADTLRTLRRRLAAVRAAEEEVAGATRTLGRHTVDASAVRALEGADDALRRVQARVEAVAARVVVDATAVEVTVDGAATRAGTVTEHHATRELTIDVAGFATVRVLPGTDSGDLADELDAATRTLAELLAAAGVEDLATARAAHEERRSAQGALDLARGRLTQLTLESSADELRTEVDRLSAEEALAPGSAGAPADLVTARRDEEETRQAWRRRQDEARQARTSATAVGRRAELLTSELTALDAALEVARTEAANATTRLEQARTVRADEELERAAASAAEHSQRLAAEVAELAADLAARDADTVLLRGQGLQTELATLTGRRDGLDDEIVAVAARLAVMGDESRQEAWDEAASHLQRLEEEFSAVARRAAAARLLHSTLEKHRDTQRRRYVSPFTDRLEDLGRTVYGDTFGITLDDDLVIVNRTLHGRTVAHEHLSTGAKEQLEVLTRLACATLVDPADGVPVVLDDALGHSDPERLRRLAAVFEHVAPTTQVVLVAPGPGMHHAIRGATVVHLDEGRPDELPQDQEQPQPFP
jgi:hypothetical protein